jgi:heme exporter protein C
VKRLKIAMALMLVGGLLTTAAFFMAFFTAEVQSFGTETFPEAIETAFPYTGSSDAGYSYGRPWFSQKIFYFHVPVAEASFLILIIAAIFSGRFLFTKRAADDTKARIAMETSLVFVILTMITGVLWTRASWGVWWEWEPRLTTYFIMMLMMIAYFVLRNSIEEEERRATYAAVFGILAAINAPISFMITRIIPSNHPVVFQTGMATSNLAPFIVGQIGMLMIGYGIYVARMSEERLRERIDITKEALEG